MQDDGFKVIPDNASWTEKAGYKLFEAIDGPQLERVFNAVDSYANKMAPYFSKVAAVKEKVERAYLTTSFSRAMAIQITRLCPEVVPGYKAALAEAIRTADKEDLYNYLAGRTNLHKQRWDPAEKPNSIVAVTVAACNKRLLAMFESKLK